MLVIWSHDWVITDLGNKRVFFFGGTFGEENSYVEVGGGRRWRYAKPLSVYMSAEKVISKEYVCMTSWKWTYAWTCSLTWRSTLSGGQSQSELFVWTLLYVELPLLTASAITHHSSHIIHHTSYITHHSSAITHQPSHIIHHTSVTHNKITPCACEG